MAQKLTLEEIKVADRKAYDERRLTAQVFAVRTYDERIAGCVYAYRDPDSGKNCGCAIGVALNESSINAIRKQSMNNAGVFGLLGAGIVDFDEEEKSAIGGVQSAHDEWCRHQTDKCRNEFLKMIDHPEAVKGIVET